MKRVFVIIFNVFLCLQLSAQKPSALDQADKLLKEEAYIKALALYQKSAVNYKHKDRLKYFTAVVGMANCNRKIGDYENVILQLPPVLSLMDTNDVRERFLKAKGWYYLGNAYYYHNKLVDLEAAKNAYFQSLKLQYHKKNRFVADVYRDLSNVYYRNGNYESDIKYKKEALHIYNKMRVNPEKICMTLLSLGDSYCFDGQLQKAKPCYDEAKKYILKINNSKKRIKQTLSYNFHIGTWYCRMRDYKTAAVFLEDSLIHTTKIKVSDGQKRDYYNGLSLLYRRLRKYEKAKDAKRKALQYSNSALSKGRDFDVLSYISIISGQSDSTIYFAHQGLLQYLPDFDTQDVYALPQIDDVSIGESLSYPISYKAEAFADLALKTKSEKDRMASVRNFEQFVELLDRMRISTEQENAKLGLTKRNWIVYEEAIKRMLQFYEHTQNPWYQEKAFYFIEKTKASFLLDNAADYAARLTLDLPKEVLSQEKELRAAILETQKKIHVAQKMNKEERVAELSSMLFEKERALRTLIDRLETEYPQYYELKYRNSTISLTDTRAKLAQDEALVEFFVGDVNTYIVYIDQEKFKVARFPKEELEQDVIAYRKQLIGLNTNVDVAAYYAFQKQSCTLYQKLLDTVLPKQAAKEHLYIVPDGNLSLVPFETLLSSKSDSGELNYRKLPYLIKDYEISYGYSATVLFDDFEQDQTPAESLLAFGPSYDNLQEDLRGINDSTLRSFRSEVSSLRWNQEEAVKAGEYLRGRSLVGRDASEENFKDLYGDYAILHFAMHALVDEQEPMQSRLVFSHNQDDREDDFLFAYELYNLKLNAQLAVLSACNTGYGKVQQGEGVASLGRAFTYAGCPSIVMSHWKVDDEKTANLMEYFYQGLAKGLNKSEALREAKLTYLESSPNVQAAPFYWGAFVLSGDISPLRYKTPWYYWLGSLMLIGFSGVVVYRRLKRIRA